MLRSHSVCLYIRNVLFLNIYSSLKNEFPSTAKLFAKHMKLDDQIDFLQRRPVDIGVGTPNRILKLSETFGTAFLCRSAI